MSDHSRNPLPHLVESYFREHLQRVRGASAHTVHAYRDTLRLLFAFLTEQLKRPVVELRTTDLVAEHILAFLSHLESQRHNTAVTRNCRLAAIRSFFHHLMRHDPMHADQYARVLSVPAKRTKPAAVTYLEPEEVKVILAQPDRRTLRGIRDHALLLFLYNTGARASEALAVRPGDLNLAPPRRVRLHGKGSKDRFCPLWKETAAALRRVIAAPEFRASDPVFRNARGEALSRDGLAYILAKYAAMAAGTRSTRTRIRVTPHVFRHSCAVALLQAGVDVSVIRDYLGHASTATTSRYISTNLQLKREALDAFWKRSGLAPTRPRPWPPRPDVLAFLASL
jgi:site-specific recombinase XerD